jgi:AcrR family transcriptional regulator
MAAEAALRAIDEEGLQSLSLEAVASRLGIKAPSLYHHFADRAELLSAVAKLILRSVPAPDEGPTDDWRDTLVNLCVATRKAVLEHPNAAPLLLQTLPRHIMAAAYEHWIERVARAGVPDDTWLLIMDGLDKLTYGSVLLDAASISRRLPPFPTTDPAQYPHLARALTENKQDPERMFRSVVRAFLDGLVPPDRVSRPRRTKVASRSNNGTRSR